MNQYAFANVAQLVSKCKQEKLKGMNESGLSETDWEAKNPDWNKVVLIPVTHANNDNAAGNNAAAILSMDMKLNSIRLVGENEPISIQVIYSKFAH